MSDAATAWVWSQNVITAPKARPGRKEPEAKADRGDKLVLLAIANQVDGQFWSTLLPYDFLLKLVGGGERSLHDSLDRLELAGYIRRRRTVRVNGRSRIPSWIRFYLLAPQSPVTQGVVTLDWDREEELSEASYQQIRQIIAAQEAAFGTLSTGEVHQVQVAARGVHNGQVAGEVHQVQVGRGAPGAGLRSQARCTRCRSGALCEVHLVHLASDQANVDERGAPGAPLQSLLPFLTPVREGVREGKKAPRGTTQKPAASADALGLLARLPWEQNPHGVALTSVIQDELGPELDELMRGGRSATELQGCLAAAVRRVKSQIGAVSYLRRALATLPRPVPGHAGARQDRAVTLVRGECANPQCKAALQVQAGADGEPIPTLCRTCADRGESLPSAVNA